MGRGPWAVTAARAIAVGRMRAIAVAVERVRPAGVT